MDGGWRIENNEKMWIRTETTLDEKQRSYRNSWGRCQPCSELVAGTERRTLTTNQSIYFHLNSTRLFFCCFSDRRFAQRMFRMCNFAVPLFLPHWSAFSTHLFKCRKCRFHAKRLKISPTWFKRAPCHCTHIPWSGVNFHGTVAGDKYEHIIHHRVLAMNLFTKSTNTGLFIRSSYIPRRWSAIFYLFSLFSHFYLLLLQTIFTTLPLPKLLVPLLPPRSSTLLLVMLSCSRIYIVAGVVTLSYRRT